MYSEIELLTKRYLFQVETELVLLELQELLKKTMKLEAQLNGQPHRHSNISVDEFYKPSPDVEYPAKKRAKK